MQYYLRDEIDVYVDDETLMCTFVFLSSRQRLTLRVQAWMIQLLPLFDGQRSNEEIKEGLSPDEQIQFDKFADYLVTKGVLVEYEWYEKLDLDSEYKNQYMRQLRFMTDLTGSAAATEEVQSRIRDCSVTIAGVGAVGSWLLYQLLQLGFERFRLIDFKRMDSHCLDRHCTPIPLSPDECGQLSKVAYYRNVALSVNPVSSVSVFETLIDTETDLDILLAGSDVVINCADEPYIGYTSIRMSRYCVQKRIPLLVGGGFDAHLASLGELIVPFQTPCSDCYNHYFQESLKDWKPIKHPVNDRSSSIGGLSSLSMFSASTAALKLFMHFAIPAQGDLPEQGGRGEFKFDSYDVDYFSVPRDLECKVCGGH